MGRYLTAGHALSLGLLLGGLAGCGVIVLTPPPTVASPTPSSTSVPTVVVEVTSEPTTPTATPSPTEEVTTEPAPAHALTQDTVHGLVELRSFEVSPSVVLVSQFEPQGHRIATYGYDKIVRIFDGDTGDMLYELRGHGDYGYAAAWSPDGTRLASGGDYTARVWDTTNGDLLNTTNVHSWGFRIAWHPDGDRFAIVGEPARRLEIIGADGGRIASVEPSEHALWAVAYSPDGALLAVSDTELHVYVYDAETLDPIKDLTTGGTVWDLEFSPDAGLLAACDDGGRVEIWETENWSRTLTEQAHQVDCSDGVFSPAGDLYFSVGDDGKLIAWNPTSGAQLAVVPVGRFIWWVSMSSDSELIALGMDDGTVRILGLP